jgi:hypothetical protein
MVREMNPRPLGRVSLAHMALIVHHFVCKKTLALAGAIIGDGGRKK